MPRSYQPVLGNDHLLCLSGRTTGGCFAQLLYILESVRHHFSQQVRSGMSAVSVIKSPHVSR